MTRISRGRFAVLLLLLGLATALADGATLCNLCGATGCYPAACPGLCRGGSQAPLPVAHQGGDPCGTTGSFSLIGTEFESTSDRTGVRPPVRFWLYDRYFEANSGCQITNSRAGFLSFVNAGPDLGLPVADGYWLLYQSNWFGSDIDSDLAVPTGRTVSEISFPDSRQEGTVDHRGYYLIAAVPETSGWDFDLATGAVGTCNPSTLPTVLISGLSLGTRSGSDCRNNPVPLPALVNALDPSMLDVEVTIDSPSPDYYQEAGSSIDLITGFQVVYRTGPEPTTSDASAWLPTHDPNDATFKSPVVPRGASTARVSAPRSAGSIYWFALRLIYADASLNTGPFRISNPGPRVASHAVSQHCGPVAPDPIASLAGADKCFETTSPCVTTLTPDPRAGDTVRWEIAFTNEGSIDAQAVTLVDDLSSLGTTCTVTPLPTATCILGAGCGAPANTCTVTLQPGPANRFEAAILPAMPPACTATVRIEARIDDMATGRCCNSALAIYSHANDPGPLTDVTGQACFDAAPSCAVGGLGFVAPLLGARRGLVDAWFEWQPDPASPDAYHLNTVTMPADLNETEAHLPPVGFALPACSTDQTSCLHPGAVASGGPLVFYQVVSACTPDGAGEGPVCQPAYPCP